jgi:hypothetical protein
MGCIGVLLVIGGWLLSGWASWEIVAPHNFWTGLLFLILWGAFGVLAQLIITALSAALD